MKLVNLFILAVLPLAIFSQNSDSVIKGKFMIGFVFSPDYCYRTLKSSNTNMYYGLITARNESEHPKFGYTTGLTGMLALGKRISLETGLLLSDKGYEAKITDFVFNEPEPVNPISMRSVDHYFYIDIPVKVNYFLLAGKFAMFVSGGVSANFFLVQKRNSLVKWDDGSETRDRSKVTFDHYFVNLSAVVGLGVNYSLTDKLGIRAEPIYRRSIVPIGNTPIKGYLYSFGIETGIFYHL